MRSRRLRVRSGLGLVAALGALALAGAATVWPGLAAASTGSEYAPVCSHALPTGVAGCNSIRLLHPAANWHGAHATPSKGSGNKPGGANVEPSGYRPADLQSAYGLGSASAGNGAGQTVAIVDAYNDPKAEEDLAAYRTEFGLGPCTAESGCFAKVNQKGEPRNYPTSNTSWSEEISLDLDMVSAICPKCHILLVEANSNSLANLGAAENEAVALGANAVSNSYGGSEFSGETSYDSYYSHSGVAITVSSGDSGYGVEYPAASRFVTAVGGTTLNKASTTTRGWNETVWSGAGAGCSAVEPNPGWQPVTGLCAKRTVADTAADANPNTGVAVYDSYSEPGWMVFGGTSVASPIVASVYALAGNASTTTAQALYGTALHTVREGTDLSPRRCGTSYLCNAKYSLEAWNSPLVSGWYNGPTGNGTPNGLAGF